MLIHRIERAGPLLLVLSFAVVQSGCCQPCCPPSGAATVTAQPGAIRYGSVCDVPGSSSAVASQPGATAPSMANAPRPKVVISEPSGRLPGQAGWRRTDPENIATRIEGAVDDETVPR
jgi:hypothetical protein